MLTFADSSELVLEPKNHACCLAADQRYAKEFQDENCRDIPFPRAAIGDTLPGPNASEH